MELRELVHQLISLSVIHRCRITKNASSVGLYWGQPMLLEYVLEHDTCTQAEIAKALYISPPSVATSLKRMEKAGLIQYGFASEQDYEDYIYNPYLHINIVQNTDAQIREMNMQCYVDGEETVEMGSSYADGSCIKKNDVMDFGVYAQDLGKNYIGISEVQFKLEIVDVEGTVYQVDTPIHIIPKERATYYYILTGNAKDGFELYQ